MSVVVSQRPTLGAPRAWTFPPVDDVDVPHGRLVTCNLPGQALLTVSVAFAAPVDLEPLPLAGVGTIAAWSLDEGAGSRDANELAAAMDRLGASLSTHVNSRGVTVTVDAPPAGIEDATRLLHELVTEPHFPDEEVRRLVRQRRDSIQQEWARIPGRAAIETRRRLFRDGSRFAVANAGDDTTMAAVDREAVVAHHHDRVLPATATAVVAGDLGLLTPEAMASIVDHVGAFSGVDDAPVGDPGLVGERRLVVVDRPGAVQTGIEVTRPGVDRHADDWVALRVAAHVLGGALTSRLDMVLREEKGFTYGARSALTTLRRKGWIRLVAGSFEAPSTAEAVADVVRIVDGLRDDGPTDTEVVAAVQYLGGIQPLKFQRAGQVAGEIQRNLADGFDATHTDREHEALVGVSLREVATAAATHLTTDDAVFVVVGDADQVAGPVADVLGLDPVVVRD